MAEQKQREAPAAIPVTPGVWVLPSQGNGFVVETHISWFMQTKSFHVVNVFPPSTEPGLPAVID